MRINRKALLLVVALIVLSISAAALVAAQGSQPDTADDGEAESSVSASEAALTQDQAVAIAEAHTGSTAAFVELENEAGTAKYSIELEDGSEVEVDANTGDILEEEGAGGDGD